jgi:hypothetical protein
MAIVEDPVSHFVRVALSVTCPWVQGLQQKLMRGESIAEEREMLAEDAIWVDINAPREIREAWTQDAKGHSLLLFVDV